MNNKEIELNKNQNEIKEIITEIDHLPEEEKRVLISEIRQGTIYAGNIPPAEIVIGYSKINPDLPEKIVNQSLEIVDRKMTISEKDAKADRIDSRLGVVSAFIITIVALCGGFYLITNGFPWQGTIFSGIGLAPIITPFITATRRNKKK